MNGDTIVARATAAGLGGVAIVRISGGKVCNIAAAMLGEVPEPRFARYGSFCDADGQAVDSGIALFFPGPHSFTGEDVLELHCHGGAIVADLVIEQALRLGARPAEAGEFSRRAFLNDKMDLSQAEALADLIASTSRAAARGARRSLSGAFSASVTSLNDEVTALRTFVEAAIDFPDEEIDFLDDASLASRIDDLGQSFARLEDTVRQGCLLRDGLQVVIAGLPNAGKSSLLNALAGQDAAIVTDIPGTTRDLIRQDIVVDGLPLQVIDTAGLRHDADTVEREGVRRARAAFETADHALIVVDAHAGEQQAEADVSAELPPGIGRTIVRNKIDLIGDAPGPLGDNAQTLNVSALTGAGLGALRRRLTDVAGFAPVDAGTMTARRRHLDSLSTARQHFDAGVTQLREHRAGELLADELREAQLALAEITGEFTSDDLLGEIFSSFCIGK